MQSYTVVGVIPSSFTFYGHDRDVYTPIGQWNDPSFRDRRISVSAHVVGRLKPGVTLAQAKADMDIVARNLAAAFPVADKDVGISLVSMKEDIVGNVQPFLLVLLAAVGFLLLIACANVANLLLARSMRPLARVCRSRGAGRRTPRESSASFSPKASSSRLQAGRWDSCFAFGATKAVAQHSARRIAARRRNLARWARTALHHGAIAVRRYCFSALRPRSEVHGSICRRSSGKAAAARAARVTACSESSWRLKSRWRWFS